MNLQNISSQAFFRTILIVGIYNCFFLMALHPQQQKTNSDSLGNRELLPDEKTVISDSTEVLDNPISTYDKSYYILTRDPRIPPKGINLLTPQSSIENFIMNARNKRFLEASYSLNLNLLSEKITDKEIVKLCQKLFYLINQRIYIDWEGLPDRPDGQIDLMTNSNKAIAGKPRRSILFGKTTLEKRDISFRVERVRSKNTAPIWLISANTVENIEPLYAEYGPKMFDRLIPGWSKIKILKVSIWKIILFVLFLIVSYVLSRIILRIFKVISKRSQILWVDRACMRLSSPTSFALGVLLFYVLLNSSISFNTPFARYLNVSLLIVVVIAIMWLITRVLDTVMLYYAEQRLDTSKEENEESRTLMTYISVTRRVITFLVLVIGISIILSQFKVFQKLGISLLASAGVATVVLGIAAQSTLGNIIAGIQIALTKPARIGDTVIMNGDWGFVEDIGFTYMVVRTWDERRLVIPLKKVISETFENWSLKNPGQIKPIDFYVDYRLDINLLRTKFKELLEASPLWNGEQQPSIQVIDATENSMKVRALCSAKDSYTAWDLHCELREGLMNYVGQLDNGEYLAKSRLLVHSDNIKSF